MASLPSVIKRSFEDGKDAVRGGTTLANSIGPSFRLAVVLFPPMSGPESCSLFRKAMVPIGDLASRDLSHRGGRKRRQDMSLNSAPSLIGSFTATAFISFEIVGNRVRDRKGAL